MHCYMFWMMYRHYLQQSWHIWCKLAALRVRSSPCSKIVWFQCHSIILDGSRYSRRTSGRKLVTHTGFGSIPVYGLDVMDGWDAGCMEGLPQRLHKAHPMVPLNIAVNMTPCRNLIQYKDILAAIITNWRSDSSSSLV